MWRIVSRRPAGGIMRISNPRDWRFGQYPNNGRRCRIGNRNARPAQCIGNNRTIATRLRNYRHAPVRLYPVRRQYPSRHQEIIDIMPTPKDPIAPKLQRLPALGRWQARHYGSRLTAAPPLRCPSLQKEERFVAFASTLGQPKQSLRDQQSFQHKPAMAFSFQGHPT